jgi:hypothetical protein
MRLPAIELEATVQALGIETLTQCPGFFIF